MTIPKRYKKLAEDYPETATAYKYQVNAVHKAIPLGEKTLALIIVGVSTSAPLEGALHSHISKALKASAASDKIKHAVILSLLIIGLPSVMAASGWADNIYKENS